MHQAPGESVQKVCPWCGRSYKRRAWPALLALLVVQTALILGGVAYMLVVAADEAESKLEDEVSRVERDVDASFEQVERGVREELDRRVPAP